MSIYQKFQKLSPYLWRKYSFTVENLNLNPLLKKYFNENNSVPIFNNKHDYFKYLAKEIVKDNPIQYLEFGVYKGASIREWGNLNQSTKSEFFGFDTFEGLPEDWTYTMKKGEFDLQGKMPIINDQRVKMIKGLFQETLRPFLKTFSRKYKMVIHLDADLFSSTLYILTQLDPFLENGDILMFDEFSALTCEFKAFNDYRGAYYRSLKMIAKIPFNGWICDQVAFYFEK